MSEQPLDEVNSGEATPNPASTVTQLTENSQDNGDTQRRLQQASLALEMALNRIVEVRQSLLQLSQSLPRSRPGVPDFDAFEGMDVDSDTGRMAPAHEMLVLTGDEAFPDPPNLEAMPQWNRRLPPPSAPLNRPLAFSGASTRPRPPSVPARQVMGDDASARWAFRTSAMSPIPDSAATTRGLRVAAREANLSEPDTYTDYLRFINTSYDDMFESMGVFPGPPAPPARPDQALRPVPGLDGVPRSEHRANDRRPPAALAPLSSWRSPDPRRWRLRPNLSPFLPFIAPPNPETHRLPTFADLTAGVASLPNPPTLDQSAGTTDLGRSVQASLGFTPEGDSIVDRYRRYHDAIHTDSMGSDVNIDWTDDDFLSWLFPLTHDNAQRAPRRPEREREPLFPEGIPEGLRRSMDDDFRWQQESPVRVTHTTETQVSPADRPASSAGRRRAWGMYRLFTLFAHVAMCVLILLLPCVQHVWTRTEMKSRLTRNRNSSARARSTVCA